jgi:hypothetical protein
VLEYDTAKTAGARLVTLLRDQAWRRDAAMHGPEFVMARFGIHRAIDDLKKIYALPHKFDEVSAYEPG